MLLLASASLALFQTAKAADYVRVIDGDTLEINSEKIRLWGIDAPERQQRCTENGQAYACGNKAREALTQLI